MPSNVVPFPAGPRWRVLIAHQRSDVRHTLRTLVEAENIGILEVADGEAALAALECARFDLLLLELDLPLKDGVTVVQLHRLLLAHERYPGLAPDVIFTLAREVRGNAMLTDHLRTLDVAGFIDDEPRPDVASLVEAVLQSRAARHAASKPAVA